MRGRAAARSFTVQLSQGGAGAAVQDVGGSPSPERLVTAHAAAANNRSNRRVLGNQQLARSAHKLVLDAISLQKGRQRLKI
jgi:hypothetical protein